MSREVQIKLSEYQTKEKFTISRGSKTKVQTIIVTIKDNGLTGQGECVAYRHYGETIESVRSQIEEIIPSLRNNEFNRFKLQAKLPAGAARNAIDCALFELEAKKNNEAVYTLAGLKEPMKKMLTAYTISIDTAENMAQKAKEAAKIYPLLKIKLGAEGDAERMRAIRKAVLPSTRLIADANEGWKVSSLKDLLHKAAKYRFEMIEQPLPKDEDDALKNIETPIQICADESFHTQKDFDKIKNKYHMINLKLDKAGGITSSLNIMELAKKLNIKIMVGCMLASSLAMAPACIIAQNADIVDLDGPLLLKKDQKPAIKYKNGWIYPPEATLWGHEV